jgi:hypothetical protein
VGREELCRFIEGEFGAIEGVLEVCANPRTGRVLVKFDERIVSQKTLAEQAAKMALSSKRERNDNAQPRRWSGERMSGKGGFAPHPVGRLLFDLLMEALLPKALNLVLPAAVAVLRR